MRIDYSEIPEDGRCWIFQSDTELSNSQITEIEKELSHFTHEWKAHQEDVDACFLIKYHRFILFFANSIKTNISGCSIDTLMSLIKKIELLFQIQLMNRTHIVYKKDDDSLTINNLSEFKNLITEGLVNKDTVVFNNLVSTKKDFELNWEIPLSKSWHQKLLK